MSNSAEYGLGSNLQNGATSDASLHDSCKERQKNISESNEDIDTNLLHESLLLAIQLAHMEQEFDVTTGAQFLNNEQETSLRTGTNFVNTEQENGVRSGLGTHDQVQPRELHSTNTDRTLEDSTLCKIEKPTYYYSYEPSLTIKREYSDTTHDDVSQRDILFGVTGKVIGSVLKVPTASMKTENEMTEISKHFDTEHENSEGGASKYCNKYANQNEEMFVNQVIIKQESNSLESRKEFLCKTDSMVTPVVKNLNMDNIKKICPIREGKTNAHISWNRKTSNKHSFNVLPSCYENSEEKHCLDRQTIVEKDAYDKEYQMFRSQKKQPKRKQSRTVQSEYHQMEHSVLPKSKPSTQNLSKGKESNLPVKKITNNAILKDTTSVNNIPANIKKSERKMLISSERRNNKCGNKENKEIIDSRNLELDNGETHRYKCSNCKATFTSRHNLRGHIYYCSRYRNGIFIPPPKTKLKKKDTRRNRVRNKKRQADECPSDNIIHSCECCDESFKTKEELWAHKRAHSTQCPLCGKILATFLILSNHMKFQHKADKTDFPYFCPECDKGFNEKRSMENHLTTHTEEKRYQCKVCGKGYTTLWNLKIHQRHHGGDPKPFHCKLCPKRFVRKYLLADHVKSKH